MISMLGAAWRVVMKRLVADWLILTAASATVVIATVLLATGPIYADAVTVSGVQRILGDANIADSSLEMGALLPVANYGGVDPAIAEKVDSAFDSIGAQLNRALVSESYEWPDQGAGELTDLVSFRFLEAIEQHASLVEGEWPGPQSGTTAAVPESVARALGLSVGDRFEVTNRRDRTATSRVAIAGIYRVDDPTDPYWFEDILEIGGVETESSFRTFGPFVVTRDHLLGEFSPARLEARWRVLPRYENLTPGDIPRLRNTISALRADLAANVEGTRVTLTTKASQILANTEQSLLVTRSGVLALTLQLSILAGYALLLTAGLLVDSRRVETNLLRSRGAGSNQVLAMAIMEGLILTVPAALAAPWLAARLLRILNNVGPLASIGLTLDPPVTAAAYALAALAAAGCVAALAIPAHRAARSFNDPTAVRGRQQARSGLQRAGVDLALLVAAGVAFWQLRTFGVQITTRGRGWLEIDPLLIGAPALGLLTGALLALRTVPLLARLAERAATARTSVVSALSAWQVARRPTRYARSALLLIMAVAIGFFSAAYTATWGRSQDDQAAFTAGANVRVAPNRRTNDSIGDLHLRQAHGQIAGVSDTMPVARQRGELARSGGDATVVLLDAVLAGRTVEIRDDLSSQAFDSLMTLLAAQRPTPAGLPLPGEPKRIALAFTVSVIREPDSRLEGPILEGLEAVDQPRYSPIARVVLQDGDGYLHRVHVGPIPVNRGPARVETDLVYLLDGEATATPSYPLSVIAIEIESPTPLLRPINATYNFAGVLVSQDDEGNEWLNASSPMTRSGWELGRAPVSGVFSFPSIGYTAPQPPDSLQFQVNTGLGFELAVPVYFSVRPTGTAPPATFPVVVTDRLLDQTASSVGGELRLTPLRAAADVGEIVGTVKEFPTVLPESGETILVDLPTFQMMNYETGARILQADEYWIGVADGASAAVTEELRRAPYDSFEVVEQEGVARSLRSDPVALGTIGSLSLGFVAAAVFAAVGFAVSAIVSARERLTEFALMRALGLTPRQLSRWLWLEQGVLVLVSLALGTLTGGLLAWLILPSIAISQDGSVAVPEVDVLIPWITILWLELTVVATLGLIVTALAGLLRRFGLGSLLRLGED